MKSASQYRKYTQNFDSSKDITRYFEADLLKLGLIENKLESECSAYFIKSDELITVGEFSYTTVKISLKVYKKPSIVDKEKIRSYLAFLFLLRKKINLFKKERNLPDSLWEDFIQTRIVLINEAIKGDFSERTL